MQHVIQGLVELELLIAQYETAYLNCTQALKELEYADNAGNEALAKQAERKADAACDIHNDLEIKLLGYPAKNLPELQAKATFMKERFAAIKTPFSCEGMDAFTTAFFELAD